MHAGHDLFPEVQSHRIGRSNRVPTLQQDKCFSVLLNVQSDSSTTDKVLVALHLEVPPFGNGRSRNEWVSAFNSLMCRKLPIYPDQGSGDS